METHNIREICWELTSDCNLRCRHCYNGVPHKRGVDLNIKQQLEICDQIAEANIKMVQLSGGEILLNPRWLEVASKLVNAGIRVSIITNGLLLNKEIIYKISETGISTIGLSIEGLQQNNDIIRGNGSYKKILQAIDLIYQCNPEMQISANTTVNKLNIKDLTSLSEELHKRHVNSWMVQLAVPDGNFKAHKNNFMIHPSQMDEIINCMYDIWKRLPMNIFLGDCIGHFNQKEIEIRSTYSRSLGFKSHTEGCGAGKFTLGIKANGDVVGCISLKDSRYVEENLIRVKLKDIIDNPYSFAWNREILSKKQLVGDCAICQFGDICKSSCPGLKYDDDYLLIENIYCSYNYAIKKERERIKNIVEPEKLTEKYFATLATEESQLAGLYHEQIMNLNIDLKKYCIRRQ